MRTCACLIVKNEAQYLLEWVAHYKNLGFDEIIIYDNNSNDGGGLILKQLAKAGIIRLFQWNYGILRSPQISAYRHAIRNTECDWIMFVDADEFLILHKHKSIAECIQKFNNEAEISGVAINWRIFGDSNQNKYEDKPLIERFTMASTQDFFPNHHVKCIYKKKHLTGKVHMHLSHTCGKIIHADGVNFEPMEIYGLSQHVNLETAQINHYYGKTIEEFSQKKARGQAACRNSHPAKYCYNLDGFHYHNRNEILDLSAQKYLQPLKITCEHINDLVHNFSKNEIA